MHKTCDPEIKILSVLKYRNGGPGVIAGAGGLAGRILTQPPKPTKEPAGMARCAVPVAERSVRRRNESQPMYDSPTSFRPLAPAGMARCAVPTGAVSQDAPGLVTAMDFWLTGEIAGNKLPARVHGFVPGQGMD